MEIANINNVPFSVFDKLDYITRCSKEKDNKVVVYNTEKFMLFLVDAGYLEYNEEDALAPHIDNYKFYRVTDKFKSMNHGEIIKDITGMSISDFMKARTISADEIPYDYEEAIDALNDVDGYFDKVDLGYNSKWSRALRFHGFTHGAGVNGHYSAGSTKLKKYTNDQVIETLTGLTMIEFKDAVANSEKTKEINRMHEIANKYGYNVLTDGEYDDLCEMADRS